MIATERTAPIDPDASTSRLLFLGASAAETDLLRRLLGACAAEADLLRPRRDGRFPRYLLGQ
jgi:hypothetical protein